MSSKAEEQRDARRADEIGAPSSFEDNPQFGRALLHSLHNAGIAVLYQDRDLKTVWARNMRAPWAAESAEGLDTLPPSQASRIGSAKRKVIESGKPERLEVSVPDDAGMQWFDVWVDADRGDTGAVQGVVTTMIETTDQKRREQALKTLLREVSHRSKNLLAIIQSIATQTGRHSDGVDDFLIRFRGRLQSLASSQDLVTSSNWRGAALRDLVFSQVCRYGDNPARSLRFKGANPYLNPNAVLHIGLAMHELAVNSVRYGALSRPDGFVEVTARLTPAANGEMGLAITWDEQITPTDMQPRDKRFGRVALERVVPASLNGTASLEIADDHLEYELVVPHGNFEAD